VNPIDELANLLPPAPPGRELPHRDLHQADLLAVIDADWTARSQQAPRTQSAGLRSSRLQSTRRVSSWWLSSWRLSSSPGDTGRRWLAPSAAAIAVACAVIVVAVAAVALPGLLGSGRTPGSRPTGPRPHGNSEAPGPGGSPLTLTRHWTVPAAAIGTIVAASDDGNVVVTGAATSTASVTAIPTYHGKPPTISVRVSAGSLTVTARCPAQEQNCLVTLKLTVPSREHVVAESGEADIRLAGLAGGGKATAEQGNVSLSRVSGGMTAIAGQGTIDAHQISGSLTARADQGNIDVTGLTGKLAANAGQGNITLTGIAGRLTAHAGQGGISATGLAVRQATLTSGQSTIDASFSQPPALVVATCQMGSVRLHLPGNSSYAVTASAQMGGTSVRVPQSAGSPHVVKATSQMGSVTVAG
jgi:hypothetical protein